MNCVLLLPRQGKTRSRLNAWLESVEEDLSVSMELDSTEMMKRFVLAGMGITFLAVSNCHEEIAAGKLHALPLAPEPMWRKLGLIYRKYKALSKAALAFIQIVMEHVGNDETGADKNTLVPRGVASRRVPSAAGNSPPRRPNARIAVCATRGPPECFRRLRFSSPPGARTASTGPWMRCRCAYAIAC